MGYEKFEREFPCPCGQGIQVAEWEEHDTWVHGDSGATYTLKCPNCAERFTYFYHLSGSWVLKEDKETIDGLEARVREKEAQIKKLIAELVERHEQPWVSYINALPNRMTKKHALGAGRGFLKHAVDPSFVETEARAIIKKNPKWVYDMMKLQDPEVETLLVTVQTLRQEKGELEKSIKKIPVPDKRFGFKPFVANA